MVSAASACRLYLVLPANPTAAFKHDLARVLAATEPACLLLPGDTAGDPGLDGLVRDLTPSREIALLVEHDVERAAAIGADGVHLPPDAARFREARERLGQRAIIGIGCIESRHEAMTMAELGADYVAFAALPGDRQAELIAWWSEIFVVPSVAYDVETPEAAARLANLGADFVAPPGAVWASGEAIERIGEIASSLRLGRSAA
jgi:thiamine-phosphate pyrophosphorylase